VLPYEYEDKVFLGIYPSSTYIDEYDLSRLQALANKIKWYLDGYWKNGKTKLSRQIENAYNEGLREMKLDKYILNLHDLHEVHE